MSNNDITFTEQYIKALASSSETDSTLVEQLYIAAKLTDSWNCGETPLQEQLQWKAAQRIKAMKFTEQDLQLEVDILNTKISFLKKTRQLEKSTISSVLAELEILVQEEDLFDALTLIREYK